MKLHIPKLGDELVLAEPWTFTVFQERRNTSLAEVSGYKFKKWPDPEYWKVWPLGPFTFPAGTKLVVDRIYIRAGSEDFDSVTFRASGYTSSVRTGLKGKKEKSVRFWAKLDDVNKMVVE